MTNTSKKTPTARELIAARQQAVAPNKAAVTVSDDEARRKAYLDQVAPDSYPGRLVKFSKDGAFVTHDDGVKVSEDAKFIVLADQTMVGPMRFNGRNEPPDRSFMGPFYGGFIPPAVETLPDRDKRQWEAGFDGKPADPWQLHWNVVLQHVDTAELFTFDTSSDTGCRSVARLLRHYDRLRVTHPGELPVVQLRKSGFTSKKKGVGWVDVPAFVVTGRWPANGVAKPDKPMGDLLDDEIKL